MATHRSYVINNQIFHVSVNGTDRYSKFHLLERFLMYIFDVNNNKKQIFLIKRFFSFILERWELKEELEYLKEDVIQGLQNGWISQYEGSTDVYYPPILIPF